ncbi:hypothetical protein M422DRAFT_270661 [Sphaerobolus stellatus SS14]|uniref:DUF6534 domain-containing protein n=1 Tax=Sphaerobolus stellatus (strain SS14) TaxID=990650 RepID=A0A0C9TFG0_SPHS4|nr:hypothetical protein M422DRAFT_270661 [Sphaerobolus stellatus SS14]
MSAPPVPVNLAATFEPFTGPLVRNPWPYVEYNTFIDIHKIKLIGALFNYLLLGGLILQVYDYHVSFASRDRKFIKVMVYFVLLLEISQTAFITHMIYEPLVKNWGNPNGVTTSPWSAPIPNIGNALTALIVQLFFAWRIWIFSKSVQARSVAIFLALLTTMQFGASIAVSVKYYQLDLEVAKLGALKSAVIVWLSASFSCDVISSIAMTTLLFLIKRETPFSTSKDLLNSLIATTVETGSITAVLALVQLVCFLTGSETNYSFLAIEFALGRLFANVLMATLSGRNRFRTTKECEFTSPQSVSHYSGAIRLPQLPRSYGQTSSSSTVRPLEVQLKGARGLLRRLVDHPDINLTHNVRRTITEIILGVIYGYKVVVVNDPFIEITEQANEAVLECAKPEKFPVTIGKEVEKPFEWTKDEMVIRPNLHAFFHLMAALWEKGQTKYSIVASMVMKVGKKSEKERGELEQFFKDTTGIASAAGTDMETDKKYTDCFFGHGIPPCHDYVSGRPEKDPKGT